MSTTMEATTEVDEVQCSKCKTVFAGGIGDDCLVRSCDGVGEALPPEDDTDTHEPGEPAEETGPALSEREAAHYQAIREKQVEVRRALSEWTAAKDEASGAKKDFDRHDEELRDLIAEGPDLQTRLPFKGDEKPDRRSVALETLGLGEFLLEKLIVVDITTIGDVQRLTEIGGHLTDVDGIGPESAGKISDAIAKWDEENPVDDEPAEDWQAESVGLLDGISVAAGAALFKADIGTLGQLDERLQAGDLDEVDGIGALVVASIALAFQLYMATKHPDVEHLTSDIGSE